jgi:hypothetical protein
MQTGFSKDVLEKKQEGRRIAIIKLDIAKCRTLYILSKVHRREYEYPDG